MGWLKKSAVVCSGMLLAGVGYMLYHPLPDYLADRRRIQIFRAKLTARFIMAEMRHQFGFGEQIAEYRKANSFLSTPLREEDKKELQIYDTTVAGVPVRVYRPKGDNQLLPGLVYLHGGGWIFFSIDNFDGVCALIARKTGVVVVAPEYRLAPEHPFPQGFQDGLNVVRSVLNSGKEFGIDSTRVAVGGDSAGGNMAAGISIALRDEKVSPPLKAQLLLYGSYQLCHFSLPITLERSQFESREGGFQILLMMVAPWLQLSKNQTQLMVKEKFLTPEVQKRCEELVDYRLLPDIVLPAGYKPDNHEAVEVTDEVKKLNELLVDYRVAPLMADNLRNLPTSYVLALGWDIFRDESLIMSKRLEMAGNKVVLKFQRDSFHGIISFPYGEHGFTTGPIIFQDIFKFINTELK